MLTFHFFQYSLCVKVVLKFDQSSASFFNINMERKNIRWVGSSTPRFFYDAGQIRDCPSASTCGCPPIALRELLCGRADDKALGIMPGGSANHILCWRMHFYFFNWCNFCTIDIISWPVIRHDTPGFSHSEGWRSHGWESGEPPQPLHLGNRQVIDVEKGIDSEYQHKVYVINDNEKKEAFLRDSETPLGVVLNGVMKREEAEEPLDQVLCSKSQYIEPKFPSICHLKVVESCLDPGFAPIAGILLQAQVNSELEIWMFKDDNFQAQSKDVFSRADSPELFDIKIIAVSPTARGLGLATDLVTRSLQLAKCLGYRWESLGAGES